MVGTHADVLVAEAVLKGFGNQFDTELAYEAVKKDATVPPEGDSYIEYVHRPITALMLTMLQVRGPARGSKNMLNCGANEC